MKANTRLKFTPAKLKALLIKHDDGVLKTGGHKEGRDFCAMEFIAKVAGEPWTASPECVHPTLAQYCRDINDAYWPSDELRTETMLPLLAEVFGSRDLKINMANIAQETIRIIVPIALRAAASMPGMPKDHAANLETAAKGCETNPDYRAARAAARAAHAAHAARAAAAAHAAARAADAAARAADAAHAARAAAAAHAAAARAADAAARAADAARADAAHAAAHAAAAARVEVYKASIAIVVAEIKRARKAA